MAPIFVSNVMNFSTKKNLTNFFSPSFPSTKGYAHNFMMILRSRKYLVQKSQRGTQTPIGSRYLLYKKSFINHFSTLIIIYSSGVLTGRPWSQCLQPPNSNILLGRQSDGGAKIENLLVKCFESPQGKTYRHRIQYYTMYTWLFLKFGSIQKTYISSGLSIYAF